MPMDLIGMMHHCQCEVLYFCVHGQWLLESSVIRGGAQNTGIIQHGRKSEVESDAYGRPK